MVWKLHENLVGLQHMRSNVPRYSAPQVKRKVLEFLDLILCFLYFGPNIDKIGTGGGANLLFGTH